MSEPRCPHCAAPLLARRHGDLVCLPHGHLFPAPVLDAALGAGHAQRAIDLAPLGALTGRLCPVDRQPMHGVSNPAGTLHAEACERCGSAWVDAEALDRLAATTPATPGTAAQEARSLLGLAAMRSVLDPAPRGRAERLLRR